MNKELIEFKNKNEYLIEFNEPVKVILDWNKIEDEIVVIIGKNNNVELIEINEKENCKISVILEEKSILVHNILNCEIALNSTREYKLLEGSDLHVAYADFSDGEKVVNARVDLDGEHSSARWNLACLTKNKDKKIFNINFNHNVGFTIANMENYGVCKDESTIEFLGDAVIVKGAKKSNTKQNAKIMVFDPTCHAKASPKLCIYENDVEASHGASEGQINSDHIFYLTSRGIDEENAKRLITLGYLNPIIRFFSDEELREKIQNCIIEKV